MARARPDWAQVLAAASGRGCWFSALRRESRWAKPPIREGWLEWRDSHGNAFYVDADGASTWDPPWRDDNDAPEDEEAPEVVREAPTRCAEPVARHPPTAPKPVEAPTAPSLGDATDEDGAFGDTYAPPVGLEDVDTLLAYERRRAAALVAAYREQSTKSREQLLRRDRDALAQDRAALDRERQLLALERLRDANRNLPARAAVAELVVATGLARARAHHNPH